jgi:hypothetical protein
VNEDAIIKGVKLVAESLARESIDYAICLNSVGSWDSELLIHVSKPPDNAYIKQIFEVNKIVHGLLQ